MRKSPEERFAEKVLKTENCWLWTGGCSKSGYGKIKIGQRHMRAHRYAYELEHGEIPEGFGVFHHCDVRQCVKPAHLFIGLQQANIDDMVAKGRIAWGEKKSRLTPNQVRDIRTATATYKELGAQYGVDPTCIGLIRRRVNWANLPD